MDISSLHYPICYSQVIWRTPSSYQSHKGSRRSPSLLAMWQIFVCSTNPPTIHSIIPIRLHVNSFQAVSTSWTQQQHPVNKLREKGKKNTIPLVWKSINYEYFLCMMILNFTSHWFYQFVLFSARRVWDRNNATSYIFDLRKYGRDCLTYVSKYMKFISYNLLFIILIKYILLYMYVS